MHHAPIATGNRRRVSLGPWASAAWLIAAALLVAGCSTYELRGRAVQGERSQVLLVDQDDPRLEQPALAGVEVRVILDPDSARPVRAGGDMSDLDGRFAVPLDAGGIGLLNYEAQVVGRMEDHDPALGRLDVPLRLVGEGKRVLVILAPGEDRPNPEGVDVLDETLRMGEPYME